MTAEPEERNNIRNTKELGNKDWERRLCSYNQESKAYRVYNPATRMIVESRNVAFIKTPLHIVLLPDDSEYHTTGWRVMNGNDGVYANDDYLPRDIRDYRSHLYLHNTSDHTIEIAQLAGTELTEILARLRELTSRDLGTGSSGVTLTAEPTKNGQQPAVHNPSPSCGHSGR